MVRYGDYDVILAIHTVGDGTLTDLSSWFQNGSGYVAMLAVGCGALPRTPISADCWANKTAAWEVLDARRLVDRPKPSAQVRAERWLEHHPDP